jgi:inositol-phosphate phosphatase/L-galactose 1-phosphate phosphatase/histidinol-phosphatase
VDSSPVTVADRDAEAAMRGMIEKVFPAHGIRGEEFGAHKLEADWIWVLDPIDGKSFISGSLAFGTQIAALSRYARAWRHRPADHRALARPRRPSERS